MTKPTRMQEQACDRFAQALVLLAEGARQDGNPRFGRAEFADVAERLARASSAFGLDQIVARALESRALALGMRAGTGELLTLLEGGMTPIALLFLPDVEFRAQVEAMENELGEV